MTRTNNRTLEQSSAIFDTVCMYISAHVFLDKAESVDITAGTTAELQLKPIPGLEIEPAK